MLACCAKKDLKIFSWWREHWGTEGQQGQKASAAGTRRLLRNVSTPLSHEIIRSYLFQYGDMKLNWICSYFPVLGPKISRFLFCLNNCTLHQTAITYTGMMSTIKLQTSRVTHRPNQFDCVVWLSIANLVNNAYPNISLIYILLTLHLFILSCL